LWWFHDFEIVGQSLIKEAPLLDDFFRVPAFKELLASEQGIPLENIETFLNFLEIQFVDVTLKNK
jgi:hypothetical protein